MVNNICKRDDVKSSRIMGYGGTYLDAEEMAYNVPLSRSPRKAMVRCKDGKMRKATCGIPDTFFSIPAFVWKDRKRVYGYVTAVQNSAVYLGVPDFIFVEVKND